MSVLIRGMEMPKTCCACFCARGNKCGITRYEPTFEERYEDGVKDCPLIPVPPHGRLIEEADAIKTVWMILNGLGYLKEENTQLEQTVREVFATAPAIERKNMDKRRTANLDGKCGSCRYFTAEQGRECCGFCSGRMKRKGRIMRTYKCIGYEAAPTILEAEDGET